MEKYKLGYTTGVFDMFHIGHLNLLKHAKEKCDFLIVGVSTDELVMEYKHKKPVIPYDERIAIISAISYVDKVVKQETLNKMDVWKVYKFDVLFHGSDWKDSDLYNKIEAEFGNIGVDVVYLPYTQGISSTLLVKELHNE